MQAFQIVGENPAITMTEAGYTEITDIYRIEKKSSCRLLVGFSLGQIIIGILCFVISGIILGEDPSNSSFVGYGFWNGFMFMVTGAIGLTAGKVQKKGLVVSFNVLSIISAPFSSYLFIFSTIFASFAVRRPRCYSMDSAGCQSQALEVVLAVLAFLEVGCAIGSSVVCCTIGGCCCDCDCGCCPPIVPRPTYMAGVNQMAALSGQQQPVILLHPSQLVAQYNPQQVPAVPNHQNPEYSGISNAGASYYEELIDPPAYYY